mgnify:CR=1 FL=1
MILKIKHAVIYGLLFSMIFLHGSLSVASNDIVVGMTGDMSNLSANIGLQMKKGIELGFAEANSKGGIKGRSLRLIALDDEYIPLNAASNTRRLINDEQVVAMIGNVGTPMAMLAVPIVNKSKTLLFGAYTGAAMLRKSDVGCCVYNYRASYKQEIGLMIDHILQQGVKPHEIAFLTQKDASGDTAYAVTLEKLNEYGFNDFPELLHTRYRKNTLNIEQSVADVLSAKKPPKAIIMISTYGASTKFINLLKDELPKLKYYHISYTGSVSLRRLLAKNVEGVYITSVVPNADSNNAVTQAYRSALSTFGMDMDVGETSLEGYIVSKIFIEVLNSIQGEINKQSILAAIGNVGLLKTDTGSADLMLTETSRQASQTVWLQEFINGRFIEIAMKRGVE